MSLDQIAQTDLLQFPRLKRAAIAVAPVLVLLLWTTVVRLPFYEQTDKDEFFFSVIAGQWLHGALPYVATFDVKPPGLFFIYAVAQAFFGASQATIKGMEIVAVALGAYALFSLLRTHASERSAWWAAILFPVFTLALGGMVAVNMLLQLPPLILAFAAALTAVQDGAEWRRRLGQAFVAGLAIGAAAMIKQTAVFEGLAIFVVLCFYGERRRLPALCGVYVLGAALPAIAFALYFLSVGHFTEMFRDAVVLALRRTDSEVLAGFGPAAAFNFTFLGALSNTFLPSLPLFALWAGALFTVLRRARVTQAFPSRVLIVAGLWLFAALAGAAAGRNLCTYYLLTAVTPLLVLASALYCHGLEFAPSRRNYAFVASIVLAALSMFAIDRNEILTPDAFLAGDFDATRQVSAKILSLDPSPERDRLLVLNRGFSVFTETGLLPPTPYFHATHLLGVFHTPDPDPLGISLRANPRFIVIANPEIWHITERRSQIDRALDYVAKHYRVIAAVNGAKDSFTLYEFVS